MNDLLQLIHSPLIAGTLQLTGLLVARLLPLVVFTPVFGGQAVPGRFRFGVAVAFALGFLPLLFSPAQQSWAAGLYGFLLLKEGLVGFTLTMFVLVLFETFTACGALIDLARGASNAQLFDPHVHEQQSVMGLFTSQLAVVLFLTVGGHRLLFAALSESFTVIPPHALLPPRLAGPEMAATMITLTWDLFLVALRLAAPVILVMFLLDICLGLINRVAPQVQVFFMSMTIKATLAILFVFLTLGIFIDLMQAEFVRVLQALRAWLLS